MSDFLLGMKVYSLEWYWKYELDYEQAAAELKSLGVNYVMTMSSHLPMYDSAVNSEIPDDKKALLARYDDHAFRKALRQAGIEYYGASNFFFDPPTMYRHGNIPVDDRGERARQIDWYIGGCPTDDGYVHERSAQILSAAQALQMDGVFLGFMRYPGFWELWLPGTKAEKWREYCFCERCLEKFQAYSGVSVPHDEAAGKWIRNNAYREWVDFKTATIAGIVAKIRREVKRIKPDTRVILNTVPFDKAHYGESGREIFAQDPVRLAESVDLFEVMAYHQMLGQPHSWIDQTGGYFKNETGKQVVCTVQVKPYYLSGMHAGKGRAEKITPKEFEQTLSAIRKSGIDGIAVFSWSDLLEQKYAEKNTIFSDIIADMVK